MPPVRLRDPANPTKVYEFNEDQVAQRLREGWVPETTDSQIERLTAERKEEQHGGIGGQALAAGLGVARAATLGGSDVLLDAVGEGQQARELKEVNQGASLAGEIAGSFVGLGGAAGKLGARIAKAEEGASLATRVAKSAAGYGAEGAIMGAGQTVSELALSDQPLTLERATSVFGSNVLFGAGVGGIVGATGTAAGHALRKGKEALEQIATRPGAVDEVAGVAFADDIAKHRTALKDEKAFLATKGAKTWEGVDDALKKEMAEVGKVSLEADRAMDRMLRNPKALAQRPGRVLDSLQQQEHALERLLAKRDELGAVFSKDTSSARAAAIDSAERALQRNKALQARVAELTPAAGGAPKTMGQKLAEGAAYSVGATVGGLVPGIGSIAAPFIGAKLADIVGEGLGKSIQAQAARAAKGVGSFLNVAEKVAPAVPVMATRALGAVQYAPTREKDDGSLASLYQARAKEIRSQIVSTPDGLTQMRPDARRKMAEKLAPIRAADPIAADRMETMAARRLTFLADNLPRKPDLGAIQAGPDRWQPSSLAMRSWARLVAAAEDPGAISERLANGSITPEDAKVMRELYPEMLAEMTQQILENLPTLRATLPYHRRLALSILTGAPVDAAMNPRILRILQGSFQSEPGTEGGTQAPRPSPQFGSVSAAPGTLAQKREQNA